MSISVKKVAKYIGLAVLFIVFSLNVKYSLKDTKIFGSNTLLSSIQLNLFQTAYAESGYYKFATEYGCYGVDRDGNLIITGYNKTCHDGGDGYCSESHCSN